jgi:hypothetical protein
MKSSADKSKSQLSDSEDLTKFQTRVDEPTPNGGAYSIAYWQNANGEPALPEDATGAEIIEFSESGEQVFRTYLKKSKDSEQAI